MKPRKYKQPREPLLLRIGVTGHRTESNGSGNENFKRPVPDIASIRKIIHEVLEIIKDAFKNVTQIPSGKNDFAPTGFNQSNEGILRIISGLASGADQWVAIEAIKLGYELEAILPFARVDYLEDFIIKEDSETFEHLLQKAKRITELTGNVWVDENGIRKHESNSYENVGHKVLSASDIIIAIWDGHDSHGKGGTGQVVTEALQNGIPVIWIPWSSPERWQMMMPQSQEYKVPINLSGERDRLFDIIRNLMQPPTLVNE